MGVSDWIGPAKEKRWIEVVKIAKERAEINETRQTFSIQDSFRT
jgi:hypothetical protein